MVLGVASKSMKKRGGHRHINVASSTSLARTQYNLGSTSGSSSRHIHHFSSAVSKATGHTMTKNVSFNPTAIQRQQDMEETDYLARTEAMTQLQQLHAATVIYDDHHTFSCSSSPDININDILSGNAPLNLSHEGGKQAELLAIEEDVLRPPVWWVLTGLF